MTVYNVTIRERAEGFWQVGAFISDSQPTFSKLFSQAMEEITQLFRVRNCSKGALQSYMVVMPQDKTVALKKINAIFWSQNICPFNERNLLPSKKRKRERGLLASCLAHSQDVISLKALLRSNLSKVLSDVGLFSELEELIQQFPSLATEEDDDGKTLLLHVLKLAPSMDERMVDLVCLLIDRMPTPLLNRPDKYGHVALHYLVSAKEPNAELIGILMDRGVNPLALGLHFFDSLDASPGMAIVHEEVNRWRYLPESGVLPTLEELTQRYQDPGLALHLYWAAQAVFFVARSGPIGAPNTDSNLEKTGNWSKVVYDRMHGEFKDFLQSSQPMSFWECLLKRAALFHKYRGGGDCIYQSAAAFQFFIQRNISVEVFEMYDPAIVDGAIHYFTVIGRKPGSDENFPDQWGPEAVIADPFEGSFYPATYYYLLPRDYVFIRQGLPRLVCSSAECKAALHTGG